MSENGHASAQSLAHLPDVVRRHVERAWPASAPCRQVRITQRGEMWLKPGGRATHFEATQSCAVDRVGFWWRARFPLLGRLSMQVVDEYADDHGKLELRLFGLPLQRQRGAETTKGEALRYLAELPFAPPAIVLNEQLEWCSLDEHSAEVATVVGDERLAVTLEADQHGDIVHASSEKRLFKSGNEWVPRPWGGQFRDYEALGGVRLPTSGEAYRELPEGRYVYWRGTVMSVEVLDRPFRRDES